MITKKIQFSAVFLAIIVALFFTVAYVNSAVTLDVNNKPTGKSELHSFFSATTTSATSTNTSTGFGNLKVAGAKRIVMYFTHGGVATTSTATSTFKVQGSPDSTNWYDFGRLVQSTSTSQQVSAEIVGATSTTMFGLDLTAHAFNFVRCIVVEGATGQAGGSGDGEHTCQAYIEY